LRSGGGETRLDVYWWAGRQQAAAGGESGNHARLREADRPGAAAAVSPVVRPSATFNYPVAIEGKWLGNKYRVFTRYRSDDPASLQAKFDAAFARLDYVSRDCFDLMWHRHTGEWLCVSERLSLSEALHRIESEPYFQPC
jgi:hypothetical protein